MKTLFKLRFTQSLAMLRNIFAKPSSAIITVIVVAIYGSILIPVFMHAGDARISGGPANLMVIGVIGFALMMQLTTLLQNKRSLFFESDAYYFFTGPFTKRQILAVYTYDNLRSSMLLGVITLLPIMYGASSGSIPFVFILAAFLAGTFLQYCLISLAGLLYLHELSGEKKTGRGSYIVLGFIALCLVCGGIYVFISYGSTGSIDFNAVLAGKELNWIPFFGWARMAMNGALTGDIFELVLGFALLACIAAILTVMVISHKGDFYERSMVDAEAFTDYYNKVRAGKTSDSGKVHKAELRFGSGVAAFFSKNFLIALKGRDIFKLQDVIVIVIYVAMAYFSNMGFLPFAIMLMFWMLMKASNPSLVDDLQHHYIYLVPGSNMKKLLCVMAIPFLQNILVTVISLVVAALLMGEGIMGFVTITIACVSAILVMAAGNVLSIRLMKSRNNKMVEQVIRTLTVLIALAPGLVAVILLPLFFGGFAANFAWLIFTGFDLIVATIVLLCCAPMMKGNELNSD